MPVRSRNGPWWRARQSILGNWIRQELLPGLTGFVLKTDLFDEASGPHHHASDLPAGLQFLGMDVDLAVVQLAKERLIAEGESASFVVCDVRRLPFADDDLSAILSLSTLDHFQEKKELQAALGELARILQPAGRLLLTLDNPANPEVFLRKKLPVWLVAKLRADRFPLGITVGPSEMAILTEECGLRILTSQFLLHSLRYPIIRASSLLVSLNLKSFQRYLGHLILFAERLAGLPFRQFTGHYIAWTATNTERGK